MGKNKPRSEKNQYKFGGMIDSVTGLCKNYYKEDQCWDQYVEGPHPIQGHINLCDKEGKLLCKGDRFNCLKQKYHWWASLGQKIKSKYKQTWGK